EKRAFGSSSVSGPFAIIIGGANNLAILPNVSRDQRQDDGGGASGLRVRDVLAEIPAVGTDGFLFSGGFIFDLLGFLAVAFQGCAGPAVAEWTAVVVAELHEDEIAGLKSGPTFFP